MSTPELIQQSSRPAMPADIRPQNARMIDPNKDRFGWMALHDIDLRFAAGRSFAGRYTVQDADGVQREAIKRHTLIHFVRQMALGINEVPAMETTSELEIQRNIMDGYEAQMLTVGPDGRSTRPSTKTYHNSPAFIAFTLMRENEKRGMCLFEEAAGVNFEECEALYSRVLPMNELLSDLKPESLVREVGERVFHGPFLFQIRDFLSHRTIRDVAKGVASDRVEYKILAEMLEGMRGATRRGWSYASATLNKSESDIEKHKNGHKGKEGYDSGDERFADAPPPQDLLFLAETGRTPREFKQLEAANRLVDASQNAVVAGMKEVGAQIAEGLNRREAAQPALTLEMLQEQLAARDKVWEERIAQITAAKDSVEEAGGLTLNVEPQNGAVNPETAE